MTVVTTPPPKKPPEPVKDASMAKEKAMVNAHYERLATARERGEKVAATFVPGNLNELLMCFDLVNNLPEVNAIQNGLRRLDIGGQDTKGIQVDSAGVVEKFQMNAAPPAAGAISATSPTR